MHELAVTQGILHVVIESAEAAGATRIRTIDLVIGALSSFVDDSVQFSFDILSRGTIAEGAILRFHREPAIAHCTMCHRQFEIHESLLAHCSACGSTALHVTGGKAFYVESIEIDEPEDSSHS